MARKCPNCFAVVPAAKVLTSSDVHECPSCQSPLEISGWSRNISAFAGLIAAAIVWRIASLYYADRPGALGWVLPVLFAYLAYSVAATLALAFMADLQLGFLDPAPVATETASAHHPSH